MTLQTTVVDLHQHVGADDRGGGLSAAQPKSEVSLRGHAMPARRLTVLHYVVSPCHASSSAVQDDADADVSMSACSLMPGCRQPTLDAGRSCARPRRGRGEVDAKVVLKQLCL